MKRLIFIYCAMLFSTSVFAQTTTDKPFFESKNFKIYISEGQCAQYDVVCNDVTYHSVNKKNNNQLTLKGKTLNVGPSQDFRGYIFKNGAYTYTLSPSNSASNYDDSQWILTVDQASATGDKVIFTEYGTSN